MCRCWRSLLLLLGWRTKYSIANSSQVSDRVDPAIHIVFLFEIALLLMLRLRSPIVVTHIVAIRRAAFVAVLEDDIELCSARASRLS